MMSTKVLCVLVTAVVAAAASPLYQDIIQQEFQNFKITHNKTYSSNAEEFARYNIFLQNKLKIAQHNEAFARGAVTYKLGITHHADLTPEEKQMRRGLFPKPESKWSEAAPQWDAEDEGGDDGLPTSVDWRLQGAVTPVIDQKQCGSCYAFSSVGALEGQNFLKTGKLVPLSVQQVVDCTESNGICLGGLPQLVYENLQRIGGIATEEAYSYDGRPSACKFVSPGEGPTVYGYRFFEQTNKALKKAVATHGPISIAISTFDDFENYAEGVYSCTESAKLDHAVLLVGYGTDDKFGDFWLVKNSWGADWGEEGYIRIARNKGVGGCGILLETNIPLLE